MHACMCECMYVCMHACIHVCNSRDNMYITYIILEMITEISQVLLTLEMALGYGPLTSLSFGVPENHIFQLNYAKFILNCNEYAKVRLNLSRTVYLYYLNNRPIFILNTNQMQTIIYLF